MNYDTLLDEVKRKAREGDETCMEFIELFEGLPVDVKDRAMKCSIEINVYVGKHGTISEEKILQIGKKWKVKDLLEDEIFQIQLAKFTRSQDKKGAELA
jgi:hypothetical protein